MFRKLLPRFSLRTLVVLPLLVTCAVGLWLHWEPWCLFREWYCLSFVDSAAISPGGARVLTMNYERIGIIDIEGQGVDDRKLPLKLDWDCTLTFSSDGELALVVPSRLGVVRWAFDGKTGDDPPGLDGFDPKDVLGLSPDGRRFLARRVGSGGDQSRFDICETMSGRVLSQLDGCRRIDFGWFSPDGSRLVIWDEGSGSLSLWDATAGCRLAIIRQGIDGFYSALVFSGDGQWLAVDLGHGAIESDRSAYGVCVWEARTGKFLGSIEPKLLQAEQRISQIDFPMLLGEKVFAFLGDGRFASVHPGATLIWSLPALSVEDVIRTPEHGAPGSSGYEGDPLVSANRCHVLASGRLWDLERRVAHWLDSREIIRADRGTFTPDSSRVATWKDSPGYGSPGLDIHDAATGARLVRFHYDGDFRHAAFSTDGALLVLASTEHCRLYRRRRPEWWWGVFWLWEFWLTAAFTALLLWSILRDRKVLRREAA